VCGRYAAARDAAEIAEWFEAEQLPAVELPRRYNVAPTNEVYIVRDEDGTRSVATASWGLIPSWSKNASHASRMINARAETVASKPAYRSAFRKRRCLVPADGYYEWRAPTTNPSASRKGVKQPFFIHAADGHQLAMAGIFEVWVDGASSAPVTSCSILTQESVGELATIHDRMPVLVPQSLWAQWLDPASVDPQELLEEIIEVDRRGIDELVTSYPVSTRVNKPGNEGPVLITPTGSRDAPAQGDALFEA
jgi:putative SOS response-associated peptidase YedK